MFQVLFATLSLFSAFANFGEDRPNAQCDVKVERRTGLAETGFGSHQFSYVRVIIKALGNQRVDQTFDVQGVGTTIEGEDLAGIRVKVPGAPDIFVRVSAGFGQNPNYVRFGLSSERMTELCLTK